MNFTNQDVFDGINNIRANPHTAMLKIKQQLMRFQSNTVYRNKEGVKVRTMSGKAAWQDAILALERQKFKDGLLWNDALAMAAQEYKSTMINSPNTKANPFDIVKNYCAYEGMISFNINQNDVEEDISELVASMIVCDGNEQKGTRTAIFHPKYKEFGCAISYQGKKMAIYMIFAEKVEKKAGGHSGNQRQQENDKPTKPVQGQQNFPNREQEERGGQNTRQSYLQAGKEFIAQLNKIRKDPKCLILPLKDQMSRIKQDKTLVAPYGNVSTKEGRIPYQDLLSELQSQYALPSIKEVQSLTFVALEQLLEMETNSQNPTAADALMQKFCSSSDGVRSIKLTNVDGMPVNAMLVRLLIGDGDRKRTGRRKLLSPICKAIGCVISSDTLIVNVGEGAKDNQQVVDRYKQGLQHARQGGSGQNRPSSNQKQEYAMNNQSTFGAPQRSQGASEPSAFRSFEGEKVILRRVKKSQTRVENGRKYRVIASLVVFEDGTEEEMIEEELIE